MCIMSQNGSCVISVDNFKVFLMGEGRTKIGLDLGSNRGEDLGRYRTAQDAKFVLGMFFQAAKEDGFFEFPQADALPDLTLRYRGASTSRKKDHGGS